VRHQVAGRIPANPRRKYSWTEALDVYLREHYYGGLNQRFKVINQVVRMTAFPRWFIKRQAPRLGLCLHNPNRRAWTAEEVGILERWVGQISSHAIAKRLHRSENSVALKLKGMKISRRVRSGYTMRDLMLCLGEDHHKIQRWMAEGWLRDHPQGTKRHDGNGHDIHRYSERDLLKFIAEHPNEINLGKVDQLWFLDLVLLHGCQVKNGEQQTTMDTNV
jgi:DNA-binding CsgD family transcriptional regulator